MGMGISVDNLKEEKYFRKFMDSPLKCLTKSILKKRIEEAKKDPSRALPVNDEINMLDLLSELPSVAERAQVGFTIPLGYDEMINSWILPSLLKKCVVFDANKTISVEKTRDETQMGYQWYYKHLDAVCRVKLRRYEIVLDKSNEEEREIWEWILQLQRGIKVEEFIKKFEEKLASGEYSIVYEPKEFDFQVAYIQDPNGPFGGALCWAIHGSLHIKSTDHSQTVETLPVCNIAKNVYHKATYLYSNQQQFDAAKNGKDLIE
ncbi:hypothetical protein NAEGRDRAFT_81932 [Naegleria gruberi]|uniref:Uncharacterized protein n=1 Tax=Naegleria gruberi TaxID=5762 RepID=D2W0I5_NAEGR|nr:uncharacterized protein NAEGRDRAFT_81932 [Naegleria gruberi]EFC37434.1 hypothetical protein NAEGRDRAFT_81932 [Naegleria gruberi]|eukprot:XP_002670178.1 hypothetical protein NAEGRDRAFT_81932 [Naegleria gruberi strain NEG-M]